jgi:prepilin-type N-terminal cleavage/methylation domain-containing protein
MVIKSKSGFTIIELLVSIAVIAILGTIMTISYSGWRERVAETEMKNDLAAAAAAMQQFINFNNTFPETIPASFQGNSSVTLTVNRSPDGLSYCIDAVSSKDPSILYFIDSSSSEPQLGSCVIESTPPNTPANLMATAISSSQINLTWGSVSGATEYTVEIDDNDLFSSSSTLVTQTGTSTTSGGLTEATVYYYRVLASNSYGASGWSNTATATTLVTATPAPTAPSIAVILNGANVQATITPVTCTLGTAEYGIRNRTNDGTWSSYTAWSTTLTASQVANAGVKYGYQAQARCYVDATHISDTVTSTESTYIHPIPTPAAPTVTANTVTDTTTWSWPAVSCSSGTTANYQYLYTIAPAGYSSGWTNNNANTSVAFTTVTEEQTYTVEVQARCTNANTNSNWSVSGSDSYVRPLSATPAPTAPSIAVILNGANVQATITPVTCTLGTAEYGIRNRTNDGTWSSYTAWSTTLTASQVANAGVKYGYQAQARCYVDATHISDTVTSTESTYIHPIPTPAAPTVTANTVTDTTTWSWPAVSCSSGTTANYQYLYTIAPAGYSSGWTNNNANTSVAFTTVTEEQTYTVEVQARCTNANTNSNWSVSGSDSYYRAAAPAELPTVTSPTVANIATTTATLGANITSDGGASITASGTCWGTSANPTTNCLNGSFATGVFTQPRTDLPSGTQARCYR